MSEHAPTSSQEHLPTYAGETHEPGWIVVPDPDSTESSVLAQWRIEAIAHLAEFWSESWDDELAESLPEILEALLQWRQSLEDDMGFAAFTQPYIMPATVRLSMAPAEEAPAEMPESAVATAWEFDSLGFGIEMRFDAGEGEHGPQVLQTALFVDDDWSVLAMIDEVPTVVSTVLQAGFFELLGHMQITTPDGKQFRGEPQPWMTPGESWDEALAAEEREDS